MREGRHSDALPPRDLHGSEEVAVLCALLECNTWVTPVQGFVTTGCQSTQILVVALSGAHWVFYCRAAFDTSPEGGIQHVSRHGCATYPSGCRRRHQLRQLDEATGRSNPPASPISNMMHPTGGWVLRVLNHVSPLADLDVLKAHQVHSRVHLVCQRILN
jgi:hypothetical protein